LAETWSDAGDELAVGIPRTRTIVIEGLGLLETQLPDVPIEQQTGVRQYADQPELSREITAEGLLSRRSVSLAVIAQAAGEVVLSGVRLPWWNVTEQRWEVAELPQRTLRVAPSAETLAPESVTEPAAAAGPAAAEQRSYWPFVSVVLALAWIVTAALWWRSRGTRPRSVTTSAASPASERRPALRKILRDLEGACAVGDPNAARRSLLDFAEVRFPDGPPRSLGALAAELPDTVAREVLALEAHIYGAAADVWRGDGLKAALAEIERFGTAVDRVAPDPLLPLYR